MSAAFICSDFVRKVVAIVSLLALSAAAQQSNTALKVAPAGSSEQPVASQQNPSQPGAPMPNAPQPKKLPQPTHVDYSKPTPFVPNPFARYVPRDVPPPVLVNVPRLRELLQNGKIMLSMNDAIAIALADNLDIAVARYNLPIADTDILRTKGGALFQGVNAGIVQNTPGGTGATQAGVSGAGAGGTSAGAGGAGIGAGGFVGTTAGAGPPPPNFEPIVTGLLEFQRQSSPLSNNISTGASTGTSIPVFTQNTTVGNVSYSQGFSPGTSLSVGFQNNRLTNNSTRTFTNPTINSSFTATLTQHLLQGRGRDLNTRFIRIAKNDKKIAEEAFQGQIISTVSQIQNIYWDLVNAYEDVKVKERSLGLAQKTLSDNQKQVEIGTLAPLDVVRAQSNVASAEQDLIVSRTNLQLQQLFMKNALTRSLPSDPTVMQMELIPTDTVQIPDQENLPPVEDLIKTALANSPGYLQQKITLQNNAINLKGADNGLLPVIDVFGFYGATGLGGVQNPLFTCGNPSAPPPPACIPATGPGSIPTTGFSDAFGNLFNLSAPNRGVGVNISIPLANRVAQATQIRSRLEYRQAQLGLKSLENQISIFVRQDAFTVEQNRARVAAAQKAQVLAQQTLDAEQKKYNLGASTYTTVLADERDLAQAESILLTAKTNYAKSKVQLDRDTAQTLVHNNIKIDEAVTGQITTQPAVPGIMQNKTAIEELTKPQQPPAPPKP
jgi:outer membrane protein TolC